MRRVVFNQKGGVGKSSITCNLAAISAARGKRTLVVDLDPQGNSSHYLLGKPASELRDTVADLMEQTVAFSMFNRRPDEFVHATPFDNLFVLPSSRSEEHTSELQSRPHLVCRL